MRTRLAQAQVAVLKLNERQRGKKRIKDAAQMQVAVTRFSITTASRPAEVEHHGTDRRTAHPGVWRPGGADGDRTNDDGAD